MLGLRASPRRLCQQVDDGEVRRRPLQYAGQIRGERSQGASRFQEVAALFAPDRCIEAASEPTANRALRQIYPGRAAFSSIDGVRDEALAASTIAPDIDPYADVWSRTGLERGFFVPSTPVESTDGGLLADFHRHVSLGLHDLAPPRFSSLSVHYPKIISRAAISGMLV